jgi:hypothetical protein
MGEPYAVFLMAVLAFLVAHFKPAMEHSFFRIEQQIAEEKMQNEIVKAKATALWVQSLSPSEKEEK